MGFLTMKAVLRQTGLSADALRAWERRYGAVRPTRSSSGRRVYSDSEAQRLRILAELVRQGHSIGTIASLTDDELITRLNRSTESGTPQKPGAEPENQANLDRLMTAIDAFDLSAVRSALSRIRYLVSPRVFAFEIVPQILFLIGKRIDANQLSISQEHAISDILHSQVRQVYESISSEDGSLKPEQSLLFCTREGDPHDFGLMMAAIACRYRGFRTHYIGRNLPAQSLIEATTKIRPVAIVLGLAALPEEDEKISPGDYLKAIEPHLEPSIEFWLGGAGSRKIRRSQCSRDLWIFESIEDLENKLRTRTGG